MVKLYFLILGVKRTEYNKDNIQMVCVKHLKKVALYFFYFTVFQYIVGHLVLGGIFVKYLFRNIILDRNTFSF